jgi:hypothetical protein
MPQADPLTALRACRRTNVGVPSDVGEVLAAMTHGSATVPDPLHPLHTHDVGACELPLPRELEPVAFAMRQRREPAVPSEECSDLRKDGMN